ncbi:MAG: S1C family serine protease [Kineosporiaceae bacterium]
MRALRPVSSRAVVTATGAVLAALIAAGCGVVGGSSSDASGDDAGGGDGERSPAEVEAATIQIVAQGTFVDPEFGEQLNQAGAGSGFLISPDGLAVTNNHVVTGAAFLEVFVGGSDEAVNARVLGVSECSDLAVIDLDGEDYPTLQWRSGEADTGLDVYAAGFPLGDPEYTLTRGIVSKAAAEGETPWASVDAVLEHDATINPGNSGGPLIDGNGQVVGVNYAGDAETRQQFAISAAEAETVVAQLAEEQDVTSIGINGTAVVADDGSSGIWVASVESGSPADEAGITGGDIITRLENIVIGTDGTMREYCDVLRSNAPDDVLQIEVLRYESGEVLEGQINGEPLEATFSFRQELGEEVTPDAGGDPAAGTYGEYVTIGDDTGAVSVSVPAEWSDVDGAPFTGEDGIARIDVRAAPDLQAFGDSWDVPGMILTASSGLAGTAPEALLDQLGSGGSEVCTYEGRQPYQDPLYTGAYDLFTGCGGTAAAYVIVAAQPEDGSFLVSVQVQIVAERDFDALDQILNTFVVTGSV